MSLPDRGTFTEFGTLNNVDAGNAHAEVRDQVAFNGSAWEAATPYVHPCITRGSDGILYDSVQNSTGQDPISDVANTYWLARGSAQNYNVGQSDSEVPTNQDTKDIFSGDWQNPDLAVGLGDNNIRYRLTNFGERVEFKDTFRTVIEFDTNNPVFTLLEPFRPNRDVSLGITTRNSFTNSMVNIYVGIGTNGEVRLKNTSWADTTLDSGLFLYFEGLSFSLT